MLFRSVPWTSFSRIVARYAGDSRAMALPCTEHFRIMAYAQLTWRESLRDIEATLGANATKLYGMGLRQDCSAPLHAGRCQRTTRLAHLERLGRSADSPRPKALCPRGLGLDVNIAGNVYALDSSTIDLCLSLFDWAPFRSTKAAINRDCPLEDFMLV